MHRLLPHASSPAPNCRMPQGSTSGSATASRSMSAWRQASAGARGESTSEAESAWPARHYAGTCVSCSSVFHRTSPDAQHGRRSPPSRRPQFATGSWAANCRGSKSRGRYGGVPRSHAHGGAVRASMPLAVGRSWVLPPAPSGRGIWQRGRCAHHPGRPADHSVGARGTADGMPRSSGLEARPTHPAGSRG